MVYRASTVRMGCAKYCVYTSRRQPRSVPDIFALPPVASETLRRKRRLIYDALNALPEFFSVLSELFFPVTDATSEAASP